MVKIEPGVDQSQPQPSRRKSMPATNAQNKSCITLEKAEAHSTSHLQSDIQPSSGEAASLKLASRQRNLQCLAWKTARTVSLRAFCLPSKVLCRNLSARAKVGRLISSGKDSGSCDKKRFAMVGRPSASSVISPQNTYMSVNIIV